MKAGIKLVILLIIMTITLIPKIHYKIQNSNYLRTNVLHSSQQIINFQFQ